MVKCEEMELRKKEKNTIWAGVSSQNLKAGAAGKVHCAAATGSCIIPLCRHRRQIQSNQGE